MTPAPLQALYGHQDGTCVLKLVGALLFVTAQGLRRFVDEVVARDPQGDSVLVDLRALATIDSTGLGLLARIGRGTLQRGRRAVLLCPDNDVTTSLRSAAFDDIFQMTDVDPIGPGAALTEVPLVPLAGAESSAALGRVILEAHRDLAALSERNLAAYRDVIAALEAELREPSSAQASAGS